MPDPANWSLALPYYLGAIAAGYALGSIPVGLILTLFSGLGDVRSIGSGNIGATNVLRTGNKPLAALTLVLDILKGTAAVLLGLHWGLGTGVLAGLGAFLGHLFPVWLNFRGGKGVATYIGVLLGLSWPVAIGFCLVWLAVAAATRYSSLAALVATGGWPVAALVGLFGVALMAFPPVTQAYLIDAFSAESVGSAFGLTRTVYVFIGSLGPTVVGVSSEVLSFDHAFAGLAAGLIAAAVVLLYLVPPPAEGPDASVS
jgi:glycerol-3-phosphate acyltransferase PlsY